jgi:hypothetical protein
VVYVDEQLCHTGLKNAFLPGSPAIATGVWLVAFRRVALYFRRTFRQARTGRESQDSPPTGLARTNDEQSARNNPH